MAESIESFVAKLQQEGVVAGKADAEKIRQQARGEADEIVRKARAQAESIVADARRQAQETLTRSQSELDLAARDVVLRLRQTLSRMLTAVLAQPTREKLSDAKFLGDLLHDMVMAYVKADLGRKEELRINVSCDMQHELARWAIEEIGRDRSEGHGVSIDLKGTLREAGFEYQTSRSVVEVTEDSVVKALADLVSPGMRELLDKAVQEQQPVT